jgi:hypothetical protein
VSVVIAEGNDTPGGEGAEPGERAEVGQRGRRSEGDLLAERRARRAIESGEHALTLRAEAAEATVRTLETHVASLQRRLQDAEEEARRVVELLDTAQASRASERGELTQSPGAVAFERELQRASQREYAEQRLRIEAEERASERERESRVQLDRLSRSLSASERDTQLLSARLETAERELAETEQAAAAERAEAQRAERALRLRLTELDGRSGELSQLLEVEHAARIRAERALEQLAAAQRSAQRLLGSLADTVARLRDAATVESAPSEPEPEPTPADSSAAASVSPPQQPSPARQPASAPSAPAPDQALRESATPAPVAPPAEAPAQAQRRDAVAGRAPQAPKSQPRPTAGSVGEAQAGEMAESLAVAFERLRARVEQQGEQRLAAAPVERRAPPPPHKHTMSLITRIRLANRRRSERRKQRRA